MGVHGCARACVSVFESARVCRQSGLQAAHAQRICASGSGFRFMPLSPQRPLQSQEDHTGPMAQGGMGDGGRAQPGAALTETRDRSVTG